MSYTLERYATKIARAYPYFLRVVDKKTGCGEDGFSYILFLEVEFRGHRIVQASTWAAGISQYYYVYGLIE